MNIIIILSLIAFIIFPFLRCLLFNLHNVGIYTIYDLFTYVWHRKWRDFKCYGIDMFVGMFGHGKTLSMTHKAYKLYKKFGDSLLFVSNYELKGIPYVPLVNFNQLLALGAEQSDYYTDEELEKFAPPNFYYDDDGNIKDEYIVSHPMMLEDFTPEEQDYFIENDVPLPDYVRVKRWKYQGYVVLIDEIEDVLSHRNYASFPLQLLNVLTQQRKKHVYIMCSAQRFFMVDKLFRAITTHVIDCNKYWRFQNMRFYDAWDYENAMSPQLVKSLASRWWFVKNKDFACYNTEQMITEDMSAKFISNEESLARIGLDNVVNDMAVKKPSRTLRKARKGK